MFEQVRSIVLKTTRGCNIRCKYCHMLDKSEWQHERISDDILISLVDKIAKERTENGPLGITLHGGESTILGVQRVKEILELLSRELDKHPRLKGKYSFNLQTNGTLITEKWIPVLKKYRVGVSISFDGLIGSNELRDNSANRVISTIELLRKNDINIGCLALVSNTSLKDIPNTIAFFEKNHVGYKINRCEDIDPTVHEAVTFEEYYDKIFYPTATAYAKKSRPTGRIETRLFNDRIEFMLKSHVRLLQGEDFADRNRCGICDIFLCGTATRVLAVNADGTIQPCGRMAEKKHILGNVKDYCFLGIKDIASRVNITKEQLIRNKRLGCDSCKLRDVCTYPCWAFDQEKPENSRLQEEQGLCNFTFRVHDFVKEHYEDLKNI